jgi:hypothetical protein
MVSLSRVLVEGRQLVLTFVEPSDLHKAPEVFSKGMFNPRSDFIKSSFTEHFSSLHP